MVRLFLQTLNADTATIDTGANAIPAAYSCLQVFALLQTDDAAATSSALMTVNGDSGAHYDRQYVFGSATTAQAGNNLGATSWTLDCHGTGGTSGYATTFTFFFPGYAGTTFNKTATQALGRADGTGSNTGAAALALGWRSTAAINQITLVPNTGGAKFKAGSMLLIYGLF
jgi:hypothetical protein